MKRYSFRLEAVLRARRAQEDVARQELARANHQLRRALEHTRAERQRYESMGTPTGVVEMVQDRQDRVWRELAAGSLHQATRDHEDLSVAAAVHQAAWREAARRVAALERLDGRRRAEHALLVSRAEAAEVDDLVTSRFEGER